MVVFEMIMRLLTVIVPFILLIFTIWKFRSEREYTFIKKRYFVEGFDILLKDYDDAISTLRHNLRFCNASYDEYKTIQYQIRTFPNITSLKSFQNIGTPKNSFYRINSVIKCEELLDFHEQFYNILTVIILNFNYKVMPGFYAIPKLATEEVYNESKPLILGAIGKHLGYITGMIAILESYRDFLTEIAFFVEYKAINNKELIRIHKDKEVIKLIEKIKKLNLLAFDLDKELRNNN